MVASLAPKLFSRKAESADALAHHAPLGRRGGLGGDFVAGLSGLVGVAGVREIDVHDDATGATIITVARVIRGQDFLAPLQHRRHFVGAQAGKAACVRPSRPTTPPSRKGLPISNSPPVLKPLIKLVAPPVKAVPLLPNILPMPPKTVPNTSENPVPPPSSSSSARSSRMSVMRSASFWNASPRDSVPLITSLMESFAAFLIVRHQNKWDC